MQKIDIPGVKTFEFTKIVGIENIEFGHDIIIDDFVFISAKKRMILGNYIHVACFTSITGGDNFSMEDFSGLSQGCRVFTGSEDFKTFGFGNPTIAEKYRNINRAPIHIEKFAIIGANSVILPGVKIGEGAAVAANSCVTRPLKPWGVYLGNRRIGERNKDAVMNNYAKFIQENNK